MASLSPQLALSLWSSQRQGERRPDRGEGTGHLAGLAAQLCRFRSAKQHENGERIEAGRQRGERPIQNRTTSRLTLWATDQGRSCSPPQPGPLSLFISCVLKIPATDNGSVCISSYFGSPERVQNGFCASSLVALSAEQLTRQDSVHKVHGVVWLRGRTGWGAACYQQRKKEGQTSKRDQKEAVFKNRNNCELQQNSSHRGWHREMYARRLASMGAAMV